jgi:2-polyprenyl-3-methyl-5-hydroxy-6-metoxy-1,4-benzoquinol methylase
LALVTCSGNIPAISDICKLFFSVSLAWTQRLFGADHGRPPRALPAGALRIGIDGMDIVHTFDRTADVSKLEGCNTRGVEYRWSIFERELATVPAGGRVLDFGAGSLRESFDLATRGFDVTSLDIDADVLASYSSRYNWPEATKHRLIAAPDNLFDGLRELEGEKFDLITAFDVLEHLDDPATALGALCRHLTPTGKLFITVPNGRTLFELAFRVDLMIARATGRYMRPGEPHLQRNSPAKWRKIIESANLCVVAHELAIGFFANTFNALQLPTLIGGRILRKVGVPNDAAGFCDRLFSGRRMAALDRIDQATAPIFRGLYGWNLFVVKAK